MLVVAHPFRAPRHTIAEVGLIGGGQVPMPDEVSLVHHGVLVLVHGWRASATCSGLRESRDYLAGILTISALAPLATHVSP